MKLQAFISLSFALLLGGHAERGGRQANGALCPNGLCQSQCRSGGSAPAPSKPSLTPIPCGGGGDISRLFSATVFDEMFKYRNDPQCPSKKFYSYSAFLAAARSFSGFGTTGDVATRERELAAFLAQTSHQTTGGWPTAPDGPYAWGYCFIREMSQDTYCTPDPRWPCSPGQKYYGRGPIQLTRNYNYGQAGRALGLNLLNNPDLVATDPIVSFKTAIWFWMTAQGNKPSSHDVIIGKWKPTAADKAARRVAGYGVITNIINGELECGHGPDTSVVDRIGYYRRYCELLRVSYGDPDNLDCYFQRPFAFD